MPPWSRVAMKLVNKASQNDLGILIWYYRVQGSTAKTA